MRFIISLILGKICLFVFKHTGHRQDDRPGMLSMKICDDFLSHVGKPKLVIMVTGTNGKSTVSSLLRDILTESGMSVAYNDWNANHRAGQARLMLDAVNIFNRPVKDAAVIEADELTLPLQAPRLKPDYIIVTNLSHDSIRRNGHPEYIFSRLEKAVDGTPGTKLILNADCPLSSALGKDNPKVFISIDDLGEKPYRNFADDFPVCPVCGGKPVYTYRHYRSIGKYICPVCGAHSPEGDYRADALDLCRRSITVCEGDKKYTYPLVSDTVFNAYNLLMVIALLSDTGMNREKLAECIAKIKMPASRESRDEANGISLFTQLSKGQNGSSASTVFEYLANEPSDKQLFMMMDEVFADEKAIETVTWLYESDFELLTADNIKSIVVGSRRAADYRVRLLLAGVSPEKIVCVPSPDDMPAYAMREGIDSIYVLHDVDSVTHGRELKNRIKENILKGGAQVEG